MFSYAVRKLVSLRRGGSLRATSLILILTPAFRWVSLSEGAGRELKGVRGVKVFGSGVDGLLKESRKLSKFWAAPIPSVDLELLPSLRLADLQRCIISVGRIDYGRVKLGILCAGIPAGAILVLIGSVSTGRNLNTANSTAKSKGPKTL